MVELFPNEYLVIVEDKELSKSVIGNKLALGISIYQEQIPKKIFSSAFQDLERMKMEKENKIQETFKLGIRNILIQQLVDSGLFPKPLMFQIYQDIIEELQSKLDEEQCAVVGLEQDSMFLKFVLNEKSKPEWEPIVFWQNEMVKLTSREQLIVYDSLWSNMELYLKEQCGMKASPLLKKAIDELGILINIYLLTKASESALRFAFKQAMGLQLLPSHQFQLTIDVK